MDISVVIPAYNEEKVILKTIEEVKEFLKENFDIFEIVIVDDYSSDKTLNIISSIKDIKVIHNSKNHGKGYAVTQGVLETKGDYILFMDADSSTNILELKKLLEYKDKYDLIIGSRGLEESDIKIKQNIFKVVLGRLGNLLIRLMIVPGIHDTQCGFKLFNNKGRELFKKLTINEWGFDFELLFLAKKYNLSIKEVPVIWLNNEDSKVKWYDYFLTLLEVFKIRLYNLLRKYN